MRKLEWMPVSEKEPKEDVNVLVTTITDKVTIGSRVWSSSWFIQDPDNEEEHGLTYLSSDDIKAWMPLPKPYKEAK